MANYNTFVAVESRHGKILLITSSARKANALLGVGKRIEVWNKNEKVASIIYKTRNLMRPFIQSEKDYIQSKQEKATIENRRRKANGRG